MANKALVTVLIGDRVQNEWSNVFSPTWADYARKHGYDIIVLKNYIDPTPRATERPPHWQKLLILEHEATRAYEDVVWLDHDILINPNRAPCIVSHHDSDRVGIMTENHANTTTPGLKELSTERRARMVARKVEPACARYTKAGLPGDVHDTANAGVIVYKRSRHAPVLREVYDTYESNEFTAKEEVPLTYHLFKHDLIKPLDQRFNVSWASQMFWHYPFLHRIEARDDPHMMNLCVTTAWNNSWFMHFQADVFRFGMKDMYCSRDDVRFVLRDTAF
ncbi:hypothetical protein [Roseospira navarrensis]|uniref:Uncharacterized protein n=1 Tax=Roseospira navarrensis TaxID=140058 RepID=A0A7X1ZH09_9PROT|nr:hypothetical protein [Roseospira navarrensis]MQX38300.1 hypothetical protein [Roseospira navarrensis]